jgi:hypothetical protein
MSANTLLDAGNRIGRSFSLGTFVPTAALALWIAFVRVLSPSYGAELSWPTGGLPEVSWVQLGLAGAAFLMVSLALHPLIFATTQVLEGYWGGSWLATWSAAAAASRHRARLHEFERATDRCSEHLERHAAAARGASGGAGAVDLETWTAGWLDDENSQSLQRVIVARDAAAKARDNYPERSSRVLPTELGNALRREEDRVGAQYGLDSLSVAGHLAFLLPKAQGDYLDDARQQLDTAVRLSAAGFVAFVATACWLLPSGWSLLLALAPLGFAYVSYRGAVIAAQEYMYAFGVLLDLNRFTLYEALHLPLPASGKQEVEQNAELMRLLGGLRTSMTYEHGSRAARP